MKNILCLTDTPNDIKNFIRDANVFFFQIEQLDPENHSFPFFKEIYQKLKESVDLSKIDLIVAEYIEALPLVYYMRKEGFFCPSIFIPHTNAYPFNILFYFLLVSHYSHPKDLVLCGSKQAAKGYEHFVKIHSQPICTFGIKNDYRRGDKKKARNCLGLPLDEKLLLYTGRFMNDKGLIQLLDVYEGIKKRIKNVLLVLSVNHIDIAYYNKLAPRLRDTILFYRLDHQEMQHLYQSVDLFISTAISIFETYGKSPLEAISCGIPAILPRWDGFPYFITPENGSLANVIYTDHIKEAPYSFALADVNDFIEKSCSWLQQEPIKANSELPCWAYYDHTMGVLTKLINELASPTNKRYSPNFSDHIELVKYPHVIQKICAHYQIQSCEEIENKAEKQGLISRENPGDLNLLHEFHDALFKTMDVTHDNICSELFITA